MGLRGQLSRRLVQRILRTGPDGQNAIPEWFSFFLLQGCHVLADAAAANAADAAADAVNATADAASAADAESTAHAASADAQSADAAADATSTNATTSDAAADAGLRDLNFH